MSPKSGGRAQRRLRRNLWISVIVVVAIAIGSFAAVFARQVVAPPGSGPRRRRVGRLHRRGAARVPGRPRRDRQHLESPRQRARRVRRAGADDGQEPDLGLHPGRHGRAAGAQPDRADGAHVLPARSSAGRTPRPSRRAPRPRCCRRGIGTIPACTSSSAADRGQPRRHAQQLTPGLQRRTTCRPDSQYEAYPSTSVDKPDYANSTVLLPGLNGACDGSAELRCVLGPAQMTGRSIASAQATQNQTGGWVVDYSLAGQAGSALWDKVAAGELPPVAGDRARRGGVLGAHHPAHPVAPSRRSTARARSRGT